MGTVKLRIPDKDRFTTTEVIHANGIAKWDVTTYSSVELYLEREGFRKEVVDNGSHRKSTYWNKPIPQIG
jgi:hypothetical protein